MRKKNETMKNKQPSKRDLATLRRRARKKLKEQVDLLDTLSRQDVKRLVEELGTHQIELEIQNEELRRAQDELAGSQYRYYDLFDLAPVGYLVLDQRGAVLDANQTAADLAGATLSGLKKKAFRQFVAPGDRQVFQSHLGQVFESGNRGRCELVLARKRLIARMESTLVRDENGAPLHCMTAVVDITGQKNVEASLRESEVRERERAEELAALLEAMPTPVIIVHDPSSSHMTGNRAANELLRLPRESELSLSAPSGKKPVNFKAVKDGRELRLDELPAQRAARGERVQDFEFSLVFEDGSVRHLLGYGTPLRNEQGRPRGAVHALVDITQRKTAEETLQRERNLLQAVIDGPKNTHLVYLDRDFNFVRVNEAYARTCGYRPEEMIGRNHFALYPHPENEAIFRRVRDTGEPFGVHDRPFEFPDQPERGVTYWDWTLTPVKDRAGEVQGLIFALQETTAHKKAEDALRASEEKYRSLFDNMINGFALHDIVVDDKGRPVDYIFREVNGAFERLTGLKAADIVGRRVTEALQGIENDPADWIGTYGRVALYGGETRFERHAEQLGKWYAVTAYSPRKGRFATIFEDITERKQAEEALRTLNEGLEQRVEQRTRFYAVLAGINETIVRRRNRQELFDEVCRIIVETGQFRLAWVGLLDRETREVRPAASAGASSYLDRLRVVAADVPEGRGPTGRAIVEGRHIINLDFETNGHMAPWRERARQYDIRSSSAFPLTIQGSIIGALTIYSDQPHFFTDEEISLLVALANNLSFALESIMTEQARTEMVDRLQASYSEIEDLYNNAPCGYHSLDKDGLIVQINDTELNWLGYRREEVVGSKYIFDFYTPEGVKRFKETYPLFVQTGSEASLEFDLIRRNGTVMQVLLTGTAVRDKDGNFLMSRSTLFDITERKESERRVRLNSDLLSLFASKLTRREYLDAACALLSEWSGCRHAGIRLEDRPGILSFTSCAGYDPAFLSEEGALSRAEDTCVCTRVLAGTPAASDLDHLTPGGSFASGDLSALAQAFAAGSAPLYRGACMRAGFRSLGVIPIRYRDRPIGVIHLADERENVLSEKSAGVLEQMALIIGEAVYRFGVEAERALVAGAVQPPPDAVAITDPDSGRIQYVNSAFERITGFSREEAVGETLHLLDSGRHGDAFFEELRSALRREGVWRGRLVSRKKDGTMYFEDCTFSPVRDSDDRIINYVSVRRDVTESLRMESIAESMSMLDNIGAVFAGVRHEIGNPINNAKMMLGVLQQKLDDLAPVRVRSYVDRTMAEIGRVENLLRMLKTFNLFETPMIEDLETDPFLELFLGLVREDMQARGIAVAAQVLRGAERIRADSRALQHVLLNLVTNAADALKDREQPRIDITLSRNNDRIRIRVSDNGAGMSEDRLKNLFRPFHTTKAHGTGLGLVIVKKMLTSMHGTIEFESRPGSGTIATIHLPGGSHGGTA